MPILSYKLKDTILFGSPKKANIMQGLIYVYNRYSSTQVSNVLLRGRLPRFYSWRGERRREAQFEQLLVSLKAFRESS
jgi:hypothetical protein